MREHFVIDPLISKRQQLLLATQLCRMVLKVRISFLLTFNTSWARTLASCLVPFSFFAYRSHLSTFPLRSSPFPNHAV